MTNTTKPALSASPVGEPALRMCGYCKTWNSKPCGEQCYLQPSDPVWTSPPASPVAQEPVACSKVFAWFNPNSSASPLCLAHQKDYLLPEAAAEYSIPLYRDIPPPPATSAGVGCDYPSCGCDFDSICRTRMAILSSGGPDAKPDGYRFRHKYSNREWEWSNEKPEGPSIHLFDVEACYTRPIRSAGVGADEIARAFEAGAIAVHNEWCDAIDRGESDPPFRPDFSEAAHDYALALLSRGSGDQSNSTHEA